MSKLIQIEQPIIQQPQQKRRLSEQLTREERMMVESETKTFLVQVEQQGQRFFSQLDVAVAENVTLVRPLVRIPFAVGG